MAYNEKLLRVRMVHFHTKLFFEYAPQVRVRKIVWWLVKHVGFY